MGVTPVKYFSWLALRKVLLLWSVYGPYGNCTALSLAPNTIRNIRFRAYCPASQDLVKEHYLAKLQDTIKGDHDMQLTLHSQNEQGPQTSRYVEFEVPLNLFEENNDESIVKKLHALPATKLCIVLLAATTANLSQMDRTMMNPMEDADALPVEDFFRVWERLGNTLTTKYTNNEALTFDITPRTVEQYTGDKRTKRKRRKNQESTTASKEIVGTLSQRLTQSYGLTPYNVDSHGSSSSSRPLFPLELIIEARTNNDNDSNEYDQYASNVSVECQVLTRIWPLLDPDRKSSSKRLESFLVAKSTDIQIGDIVWDPMCKRGTFLVEAAKYWPVAEYHGMDTNRGHLEHVRMNAASTKTRVSLHAGTADHIPAVQDQTVDKIMTCIVPLGGSSNGIYYKILSEWARVLRVGGKMNLVVDTNFIQHDKIGGVLPANCRVIFVRSASFKWGKGRANIMVIKKVQPTGKDPVPVEIMQKDQEQQQQHQQRYPTGLFDWERSEKQGISVLGRIRAETIPLLVPVCQVQKSSKLTTMQSY